MNKKSIKNIQDSIGHNLALFVGAGASISYPTNLPSFYSLRNQIITELFQGIENHSSIEDMLKTTNTKPELLLHVIWEYMDDKINPIEGFQYAPSNINHNLIANLCRKGIRLIITTNFDQCIEKALNLLDISFITFCGTPSTEEEFRNLYKSITETKEIIVWKPHGDSKQPSSLCYTMEQVAQLNNSKYLKLTYNCIFEHFNILTLGYSGYDDDFFPLLYEYPSYKKTRHKIFWNSFEIPKDNTPPYELMKSWKKQMEIIVGDMKDLLLQLLKCNTIDFKEELYDWKNYIHKEIQKISIDDKITIIGKYLFLLLKFPQAITIWNHGLNLPSISKENRLRFITNTKPDMKEFVFNESMKEGFYKVAAITLINLTSFSISNGLFEVSYKYLREFKKLSQTQPNYFLLSDYYSLAFKYFEGKYKNNDGRINHICKQILKKRINLLEQKGNILELISTISRLGNILSAEYNSSKDDFEQILKYIPMLEAYNIHSEIAGLYYTVATLANQVSSTEDANKYLNLCEKKTSLCYELKIYTPEVYWELLSLILHELSSYGTAKEAISLNKKSIELIDKIQDISGLAKSKETYYGTYYLDLALNQLILKDYKNAKQSLETSLQFCKKSNDLRMEARALHGMGKLYYAIGNKSLSKDYLFESLNKMEYVGENTHRVKETLKKCGYI